MCGWHSNVSYYKYAWIGVSPNISCRCHAQAISPNGNYAIDAVVTVIAHELTEAATDPLGTGWYGYNYIETGDQCAWYFPNSYKLASGASYNLVVSGNKYFVQANWNLNSEACTMS